MSFKGGRYSLRLGRVLKSCFPCVKTSSMHCGEGAGLALHLWEIPSSSSLSNYNLQQMINLTSWFFKKNLNRQFAGRKRISQTLATAPSSTSIRTRSKVFLSFRVWPYEEGVDKKSSGAASSFGCPPVARRAQLHQEVVWPVPCPGYGDIPTEAILFSLTT